MAINRTDKVLTKLHSFVGTALNSTKVQFALDNWENEEFPRKLESQVRRWFKEHGCVAKFADLQAQYAPLDEQSARWLIDPCVAAQNAIIKLDDEDDLAMLIKRAATFTEISPRLWKLLVDAGLSRAAVRKLLARDDVTRAFKSEHGEAEAPAKSAGGRSSTRRSRASESDDSDDEDDAPVVRKTRKIVEKATTTRRTGKAVKVERVAKAVKPKIKAVSKDYDLDDEDEAPKKTVKKVVSKKGTTSTRRKAVSDKPAVNERAVTKTARTVRRPRT